ncbi:hypothetical protein [Paenibacillus dendrobii]|uniref:hypothetical protein n=1 Tax=Paenibacillus dendrobii TaxID=2691084 RepID=UPI0013697089|nr:hypothetical protein [Paenibacillus dendrobii]
MPRQFSDFRRILQDFLRQPIGWGDFGIHFVLGRIDGSVHDNQVGAALRMDRNGYFSELIDNDSSRFG